MESKQYLRMNAQYYSKDREQVISKRHFNDDINYPYRYAYSHILP